MKTPLIGSLWVLGLLLCATKALAGNPQCQTSADGATQTCTITEPVVNQESYYEYQAVRFHPGDGITIQAGGCVQTGGIGSTWKRYVDPRPASENRFYGTIWIPGVVGNPPGQRVTPIRDVIGRQIGVPANANPVQLYLRLGYVDEKDGYGDNGYSSHDDGTDDQCKGSQNAYVIVTIRKGAGGTTIPPSGTPAPFDLVSDDYDDNLIPLNPSWGYAKTHNGQAPAPEGCPSLPGDGIPYAPDRPPCTSSTTLTSLDDSTIWSNLGAGRLPAGCGPHGNWGPATYTGYIEFESHADPVEDDDYSWYLYPPNGNGLTAGRDNLEPEFNSHETIEFFSSLWWTNFRDAVNRSDLDGKQMLIESNGQRKFAIITGLMGLDFEHGIHSELHPIFAMAIRVKDDDPSDEHWAMFVRRFGDEGFCSSHQHYLDYLPSNQFTVRLPLIWGPNAEPVDPVQTDFRAEHSGGLPPQVQFVKGQGVLVTFDLPEVPAARQIIHGELHITWMNATARTRPLVADGPSRRGHSSIHAERNTASNAGSASSESLAGGNTGDLYVRQLLESMTPAQRNQLNRLVPAAVVTPSKVILPRTTRITKLTVLPRRAASVRRPSVSSVLDAAKVQRDTQLVAAIKSVTGGVAGDANRGTVDATGTGLAPSPPPSSPPLAPSPVRPQWRASCGCDAAGSSQDTPATSASVSILVAAALARRNRGSKASRVRWRRSAPPTWPADSNPVE
jgi:hypothetical protein